MRVRKGPQYPLLAGKSNIYIIITVTWSEVPDHVKLTSTDHQIKRDAERRVWSSDPRLSTRTWSAITDQVFVIMINFLYTFPTLSKIFEKNILDHLFNVHLQIKNTFEKEFILMRTINRERWNWVENHFDCMKKICLCLGVGFVGSFWNRESTFLRCDMNDVTIPHALYIEKKIVYYVNSFREGWNHCVVIRSIRSHSVKCTDSRLRELMVI